MSSLKVFAIKSGSRRLKVAYITINLINKFFLNSRTIAQASAHKDAAKSSYRKSTDSKSIKTCEAKNRWYASKIAIHSATIVAVVVHQPEILTAALSTNVKNWHLASACHDFRASKLAF